MSVVLGAKLVLVSSSIAISKEYEFENLLNDASAVSPCPCAHTPTNWHKLKTIVLGKYETTNNPPPNLLAKVFGFFQLQVVALSRNKRGSLK